METDGEQEPVFLIISGNDVSLKFSFHTAMNTRLGSTGVNWTLEIDYLNPRTFKEHYH